MKKETKVIEIDSTVITSDTAQNNALVIEPVKVQKQNALVIDSTLSVIQSIAQIKDGDIAKMQALIEMRNADIARQANQDFAKDFVLMSGELPLVHRSKRNKQTSSNYAALEDVNEAVKPILKRYGFAVSTIVTAQSDKDVTVQATLLHKGGAERSHTLTMPLDKAGIAGTVNKTTVHAIASSITYAKRVSICAILNISTGDDYDGNELDEDGNPIEKKKSNFQDRVKQDANKTNKPNKKPAPTKEEKEEPWDRRTIHLPGEKTYIHTEVFESSATAAKKLIEIMSTYESKEARIECIALNGGVTKALIKKNESALIDSLHKLADEGK